MYGINLVLLLLLLIFYNTLLSYSLVLIRTITAPGIPVRRNIGVGRRETCKGAITCVESITVVYLTQLIVFREFSVAKKL